MTELFLIAHKCRGEPTFDIAERLRCPECEAHAQAFDDGSFTWGCDECAGEGYWWILSTCGYRAYPWWSCELLNLMDEGNGTYIKDISIQLPPDARDCFAINDRGHKPIPDSRPADLLTKLGLVPKHAPIRRL